MTAGLALLGLGAFYCLIVVGTAGLGGGHSGAERVVEALHLDSQDTGSPELAQLTARALELGEELGLEVKVSVLHEGVVDLAVREPRGGLMVPSSCELQVTPQGWSPDCEAAR